MPDLKATKIGETRRVFIFPTDKYGSAKHIA